MSEKMKMVQLQNINAVGSKRQAGFNVFGREVREVCQNLRFTHATGEIFEHVRYRHARAANSRFAAALARLNGDDLAIIHAGMITKRMYLAR